MESQGVQRESLRCSIKVTASQQAKVKTLEKMFDWCIKEPIEKFGSIGYNNKCVYPENRQFHYPKSTLEKFWGKGIVTFHIM